MPLFQKLFFFSAWPVLKGAQQGAQRDLFLYGKTSYIDNAPIQSMHLEPCGSCLIMVDFPYHKAAQLPVVCVIQNLAYNPQGVIHN